MRRRSGFKDLLRECGICVPEHEISPPKSRPRGDSKMKKWPCDCTTLRVVSCGIKHASSICGAETNRFWSDPRMRCCLEDLCGVVWKIDVALKFKAPLLARR